MIVKFLNYKSKRKGGYTLIEILISITIIITISSIALNTYKSTKNLNNTVVVSAEQSRLMAFMLNCKAFCASNNKVGIVILDIIDNKLFLQVDLKRVMTFKLQEGLKFYGGIKENNLAYVGSNGKLKLYGAIQIEDASGTKHNVNFNVALGTMNAV